MITTNSRVLENVTLNHKVFFIKVTKLQLDFANGAN